MRSLRRSSSLSISTTKWNTPLDRLDRLERAELLFKQIGIPYSIYNRGLYLELKEQIELQKKQREEEEFYKLYPELKLI